MAGALIVTAEFGAADFAWLDRQRRAYFPPHRNQLAAHLTMFHALPPSVEAEVRGELKTFARAEPPQATISGVINLGGGVAYRIESQGLEQIRADLAHRFAGLLTAEDASGWRPHVTVQNKVVASEAKILFDRLREGFEPRPLIIAGLALNRYLGGPWEALGRWSFRV